MNVMTRSPYAPMHDTRGRMWFLGTAVEVLISATEGPDGLCVIAHQMPSGDSPPLHVHRNEDEIFHILSGRLRFRVGASDILVGPGETVLAPKGVPHTYRVLSEDGARCLTITRGPDFETMVRTLARPALNDGLPQPEPVTPDMAAHLAAICTHNGIDLVGPPLM